MPLLASATDLPTARTPTLRPQTWMHASAPLSFYREEPCVTHPQEDAHAVDLEIDSAGDTACFGVFDGHAGGEAAAFCARHIVSASCACVAPYMHNRLPRSGWIW